jgi:type IV fimbrial biogenesis protein FimT
MDRRHPFQPRPRGFTLIEAMVTIAVLVILLMVAAPSFRSFTEGQRIKNAASELGSALSYARSEAIARRANVVVTAVGGDFAQGWTVAAPGPITLREQANLGGIAVTATATTVTYGLDGRTGATFDALIKAPAGSSTTDKRCLWIDPMGTPRTRRTTAASCS